MLFALLCGHAISDFALQSESMGLGKSRHKKPPYIPKGIRGQTVWLYYLTAHAFINGGVVYLITQSQFLGITETIVHWVIDFHSGYDFTHCGRGISAEDIMAFFKDRIIYKGNPVIAIKGRPDEELDPIFNLKYWELVRV